MDALASADFSLLIFFGAGIAAIAGAAYGALVEPKSTQSILPNFNLHDFNHCGLRKVIAHE